MLLTGTFERSVDEKLRLGMPKSLRDSLGENALYLAPGTDHSLALYGEKAFAEVASRLSAASPNAQNVRGFSRLFYARAQRVELDKAGRLRIPAGLAGLAEIKEQVILVGVGDHVELWEPKRWKEYLLQNEPMYDEIAERAFEPAANPIPSGHGKGAVKPLPR